MKQITAKTIAEALAWIDGNAHHKVEIENHEYGKGYSHLTLSNYHAMMRIPAALVLKMDRMYAPNKRMFDTRMYALTSAGRRYLNRELLARGLPATKAIR